MSDITTTVSVARRLRPRTLAVIAGGAAVAIGAGGFLSTTALFTSQDRVESNTFTTATLTVDESNNRAFDVKDMLPGATGSTKTLSFENAGTVAFDYDLGITDLTATVPAAAGVAARAAQGYATANNVAITDPAAVDAGETAAADVTTAVLGWFDVTITDEDGLDITGHLNDLSTFNEALEDAGSVAAPINRENQEGETVVTVALNSKAGDLAQGAEVGFDVVIDAKQQQPQP
ncbi:hypothetical protein D6T64_05325 [Cryobacterium melibiosiphilum]|uniref:Camelysin metallo-endopeptidase n=1 Tax=Cryobacterium melibiosiphilum TaxID=995039 RepID=A0A3A5MS35_9MICO|nr:hypothetical protein [Cryobacterium melibiosiphilum]RJT89883.1 hypothetical protein D6T64_05325 [Cryobacterium melibiosiphilum]